MLKAFVQATNSGTKYFELFEIRGGIFGVLGGSANPASAPANGVLYCDNTLRANSWNNIVIVTDFKAGKSSFYVNGNPGLIRENQGGGTTENLTHNTTNASLVAEGASQKVRFQYTSNTTEATVTSYIDDIKIYRKQALSAVSVPNAGNGITSIIGDSIALTFNNDMRMSAFTPEHIILKANGSVLPLSQSDISFNSGDGANGSTTLKIDIPGGFDNTKSYTLSLDSDIKDVFGQLPPTQALVYEGSNYESLTSAAGISAVNYSYSDAAPVTALITGKTLQVSAEVNYAESVPGGATVFGVLYNSQNQIIGLDVKTLTFSGEVSPKTKTCAVMEFPVTYDAYKFKVIVIDGTDNIKPFLPLNGTSFTQVLNR
jgi:hypothetical protein